MRTFFLLFLIFVVWGPVYSSIHCLWERDYYNDLCCGRVQEVVTNARLRFRFIIRSVFISDKTLVEVSIHGNWSLVRKPCTWSLELRYECRRFGCEFENSCCRTVNQPQDNKNECSWLSIHVVILTILLAVIYFKETTQNTAKVLQQFAGPRCLCINSIELSLLVLPPTYFSFNRFGFRAFSPIRLSQSFYKFSEFFRFACYVWCIGNSEHTLR